MKAIIYVVICLSFCTQLIQCSCLSYGHSCWGGHGKRASNGITSQRIEIGSQPQPDRWALFKNMQNDIVNNIYRKESNLRASRDDSMDLIDKKPQNEQMSKQNIPVFIVDSSFDENGIVQPAINYILRKRKFAAPADLFPTPKPDTSYETTHYSIQSDDVYVPPNNPFYKFLME